MAGRQGYNVIVFNPLPTVLQHYEVELCETLARVGVSTTRLRPSVGTDSNARSRSRRGLTHFEAVIDARQQRIRTVITWPSFGYIESWLWQRCNPRATLIVHDPTPIRKQQGYGLMAELAARAGDRLWPPEVVCHSADAARDVARRGIRKPTVCLHPIMKGTAVARNPVTTVLVAGQFKPTRDVSLLEGLGARLATQGIRARIVGRGWPKIAGWAQRTGFLSEADLTEEIAESSVVLVPYRRYWQSGIAIRALELGVPAVGTPTEFLSELMGASYSGLVRDESVDGWMAAVERAVDARSDLLVRYTQYREKADSSWRLWVGAN